MTIELKTSLFPLLMLAQKTSIFRRKMQLQFDGTDFTNGPNHSGYIPPFEYGGVDSAANVERFVTSHNVITNNALL